MGPHPAVLMLTHQWGAGPAARTASARGRCTCCSSSRSRGPAAPRCGRRPPGASRSRGSSSPAVGGPCEGQGGTKGPRGASHGVPTGRSAGLRARDPREHRGNLKDPGLGLVFGSQKVSVQGFWCTWTCPGAARLLPQALTLSFCFSVSRLLSSSRSYRVISTFFSQSRMRRGNSVSSVSRQAGMTASQTPRSAPAPCHPA